jgi:flavin-dependent dehydrogenase
MIAPLAGDISICGLGPAGVSTWLHLNAREELLAQSVDGFDRARFPRAKPCGGGITPLGVMLLGGLGISPSSEDFQVIDAVEARGRLFASRVDLATPMIVVNRRAFDNRILAIAKKRGLRTHEGAEINLIERRYRRILIHENRNQRSCVAVVGADGAQSTVRNSLIGRDPGGLCRLVEVVTPDPHPDERRTTVMFDFSAMAEGLQGYTWRFPCVVDGKPCLNWGVFDSGIAPRGGRVDLSAPLRAMMEREGVSLERSDVVGHPIRRFDPDGTFSVDRAILVGDAAGVDPALGEGIALALDYGDLAAHVLADAFRRDDFSFSDYRDRLFAHPVGQSLLMRHEMAKKMYAPDGPGPEGAAEIMAHWMGQAAVSGSQADHASAGNGDTDGPPTGIQTGNRIELSLDDSDARSSLSVILAASLLSKRPSWLQPAAAGAMLEIVEQLPDLVDSAGFEVRLAANAPQVDIGVSLRRSPELVEHWREFADRKHASAPIAAAWRQLDRFLVEWSDSKTAIGTWVWSIFLEVDGSNQKEHLPCVFATFDWPVVESAQWREECLRSWEVARRTFEILHPRPVDAAIMEMARRCFEALPMDGRVVHGGAMLGREEAGVRLSIAVPRSELRNYLNEIGLDGAGVDGELSQLCPNLARAHFECDVRRRCGNRLGFVLAEPDVYRAAVEMGIRNGCCDPRRAQELLQWGGTTELGRDLVLHRGISHLKLTLGAARAPEIKAYVISRIECRQTAQRP